MSTGRPWRKLPCPLLKQSVLNNPPIRAPMIFQLYLPFDAVMLCKSLFYCYSYLCLLSLIRQPVATSVVGGWVCLTPGRSNSWTEVQSDNDAPIGKSVFCYLLYIIYVRLTFYALFWRTSPAGFAPCDLFLYSSLSTCTCLCVLPFWFHPVPVLMSPRFCLD